MRFHDFVRGWRIFFTVERGKGTLAWNFFAKILFASSPFTSSLASEIGENSWKCLWSAVYTQSSTRAERVQTGVETGGGDVEILTFVIVIFVSICHQCTNFVQRHPILFKIECFLTMICSLKIHSIYVNCSPLSAMKIPRSLYKNLWKSIPKACTYVRILCQCEMSPPKRLRFEMGVL